LDKDIPLSEFKKRPNFKPKAIMSKIRLPKHLTDKQKKKMLRKIRRRKIRRRKIKRKKI